MSSSELLRDKRTGYKTDNPVFDEVKYARITVFSKCIVVIHGAWICFIFSTFHLRTDWWNRIGL